MYCIYGMCTYLWCYIVLYLNIATWCAFRELNQPFINNYLRSVNFIVCIGTSDRAPQSGASVAVISFSDQHKVL